MIGDRGAALGCDGDVMKLQWVVVPDLLRVCKSMGGGEHLQF